MGAPAVRRFAVITSVLVGGPLGLVAGAAIGFRSAGIVRAFFWAGFGCSGGLLVGAAVAALMAWLLDPNASAGPEADYDDAPPAG